MGGARGGAGGPPAVPAAPSDIYNTAEVKIVPYMLFRLGIYTHIGNNWGVPSYRISQIAQLLNVSDDTIRRWIDEGLLEVASLNERPRRISGASVVKFLRDRPEAHRAFLGLSLRTRQSLRNNLPGIITNIVTDKVMAQVEMQCGPYRVVSLVSAEAVREMQLEVGTIAAAQIKATNVSIQRPLRD